MLPIGPLSQLLHITSTTSDTNFVTLVKLHDQNNNVPPIVIHPIYLFPSNTCRGLTITANSRLTEHIRRHYPLNTITTRKWMFKIISA
jgi:hypothetical protein